MPCWPSSAMRRRKLRMRKSVERGHLGFRGEALPSIASVSRLRLETRAVELRPEQLLRSTAARWRASKRPACRRDVDYGSRSFFNTPARKKFLKAEPTELSHIASLVTHYALAHPEKHFELHSAANAMLVAPPVAGYSERVYQVFGKETLDQLIAVAACSRWSM